MYPPCNKRREIPVEFDILDLLWILNEDTDGVASEQGSGLGITEEEAGIVRRHLSKVPRRPVSHCVDHTGQKDLRVPVRSRPTSHSDRKLRSRGYERTHWVTRRVPRKCWEDGESSKTNPARNGITTLLKSNANSSVLAPCYPAVPMVIGRSACSAWPITTTPRLSDYPGRSLDDR